MPACSNFCDDFEQYRKHLIITVEEIIREHNGTYKGSMRTLEILKEELNWLCRTNETDSYLTEVVYAYNNMYTIYCKILERKKR
jgi:hypothetical protein